MWHSFCPVTGCYHGDLSSWFTNLLYCSEMTSSSSYMTTPDFPAPNANLPAEWSHYTWLRKFLPSSFPSPTLSVLSSLLTEHLSFFFHLEQTLFEISRALVSSMCLFFIFLILFIFFLDIAASGMPPLLLFCQATYSIFLLSYKII